MTEDYDRTDTITNTLENLLDLKQSLEQRDERRSWNGEETLFDEEIRELEQTMDELQHARMEVTEGRETVSEELTEEDLSDRQMAILEDVVAVAERIGEQELTLKEYRKNSHKFDHNHVYNNFESWNELKEMVGLEASRIGG